MSASLGPISNDKSNDKSNDTLLSPFSFMPMSIDDLEEVVEIENRVYSHPWTHGNFVDSIAHGYQCWTLRHANQELLGYFFMMYVVDEAHLLNISVHANYQGRGIGMQLLDKVALLAREHAMASVLLEVRPSNPRAIVIYQRFGFIEIGRRPSYYPAAGNQREDAIVMRLSL
ncbi:ribosomal protein S18-alanine N-acetyltransferase [Glaciimonas sp. GNP009]|uniref:ribosomal protein S18-alanine N-acetyltransferase n=1 Tax=unclassified Glaciimonas TaxID=2644401 RepID=UPI002B2251CA|nr:MULTISPECIES: ribosomal protein S18-alanine N-acetyltransferase [unclassified Glaciimonas]